MKVFSPVFQLRGVKCLILYYLTIFVAEMSLNPNKKMCNQRKNQFLSEKDQMLFLKSPYFFTFFSSHSLH